MMLAATPPIKSQTALSVGESVKKRDTLEPSELLALIPKTISIIPTAKSAMQIGLFMFQTSLSPDILILGETPAIMKIARILDEPGGTFRLEYDDTLGHKRNTRLDAMTYDQAVREARSYLEIGEGDRDSEGTQWDIE
jgi:hypothetical protein